MGSGAFREPSERILAVNVVCLCENVTAVSVESLFASSISRMRRIASDIVSGLRTAGDGCGADLGCCGAEGVVLVGVAMMGGVGWCMWRKLWVMEESWWVLGRWIDGGIGLRVELVVDVA